MDFIFYFYFLLTKTEEQCLTEKIIEGKTLSLTQLDGTKEFSN